MTGNEQVINVCITEGQPTENLVNETLEGLCGIAQAKTHAGEFEQPKGCSDSRLRDIGGLNRDLVVRPD